MKKRIAAIIAAVLVAALAVGAAIALVTHRSKIRTELPIKKVSALMSTELGELFILNDQGLHRYDLSSDRELSTLYDAEDLSNIKFEWVDHGTDITYTNLQIDRLLPIGEDGVTIVGKYTRNSLSRDAELFVLQDAADLGFTAGYFTELERCGSDFINGVSADDNGLFFKLNAVGTNGKDYSGGSRFSLVGRTNNAEIPDGVTGDILLGDDYKTALFLVETKEKVELTDGAAAVKSYDRARVADAFVDGDKVYVIYKDGRVTVTDTNGNETDFKKLESGVSEVHDALLYDGELYWFDKDGIKTSAKEPQ